MSATLQVVGLVVVVAVVAGSCRRVGISAPVALVAVGVALSFVPGVPHGTIDPHLVLTGLLPPLLYAAAIQMSLVDLRARRVPILLLAVGLVGFTTVVVGVVAHAVVPGLPLAAALALGAVVAPTDAVAATVVARRVGMPRSLVTVLEGESMVNDATALVALSAASVAITQHVSVVGVGREFVVAVAGGLAVAAVATGVLAAVRQRLTDPVLDTVLSFLAPYLAFLPAQAIGGSGALAVVATGVLLGHKRHRLQTPGARIAEDLTWRSVRFLLENAVFLLIGLQLRDILQAIGRSGLSATTVVGSCAAVLAATIAARFVWLYAGTAAYRLARTPGRGWTFGASTAMAWSGMRGVVTLAAVLLLPANTPQLDLLRLVAFVAVAGTLALHGLTLPWLLRHLRLGAPDPAEDALAAAALVTEAGRAALARLDELASHADPPEVLQRLRDKAADRTNGAWERLGRATAELEPPSAVYRRLRGEMLEAERTSILRTRALGSVDEEVLRAALDAIDIEETLLDRAQRAESMLDHDLVVANGRTGDCEHLRRAPLAVAPRTPAGCEECLRDGTRWVHLRLCLGCGHVGCCESSVGNHATRHFEDSSHPVMRSLEPGEAWRWCYVEELLG
ncbi:MAG: sodium:proton antiporter [Mycobacterium sp.]|nr:sodium:proton antiporter [Mycobacterium sp.]